MQTNTNAEFDCFCDSQLYQATRMQRVLLKNTGSSGLNFSRGGRLAGISRQRIPPATLLRHQRKLKAAQKDEILGILGGF
jgi:hypothetical protein